LVVNELWIDGLNKIWKDNSMWIVKK